MVQLGLGETTPRIEQATLESDFTHTDLDELTESIHTVYTGAMLTWAIDAPGSLHDWICCRVAAVIAPHRPR